MIYTQIFKNTDKKDLNSISFSSFGIVPKESFDKIELLKHVKSFNNYRELEKELNKLIEYIYDGERTIFFHEFRQFPYIQHSTLNSHDAAGHALNYTSSDICLIKFLKKFIKYKHKKYTFFDVDFLIRNTNKIEIKEYPIVNMPIDEVLK